MNFRQNPQRLYLAHAVAADGKTPEGRPLPPWESLGPREVTQWTAAALAAAGFPVHGVDPTIERLARELRGERVSIASDSLYWTLRLWSRMSASRLAISKYASPDALSLALHLVGLERVETLLGPLLHPGEAAQAESFMRELAVLSMLTADLRIGLPTDRWPDVPGIDASAVRETFMRIADCYEALEDADHHPRHEGRLFRAAARLVVDLVEVSGASWQTADAPRTQWQAGGARR
jgi:hypothetical protein